MIIRVKNLRLRTVLGFAEWERDVRQDVVVNIELEYDADEAVAADAAERCVDYKTITKSVIAHVEESRCFLLETLARGILDLVMSERRVQRATVEVDKPGALRYTDSVSATCSAEREA